MCLFCFILLIKDLQSNTVSGTDEFTQDMSGSLMSKRLRMYKCERCNSQYMGLAMLRQHCKDVHGDQKYYKCHVCGKLFSHPSSRNIHLRLHSGEKPYKCTTCGKQFRVSSHLKDHVRVHTGVWNFFSFQDHAVGLAVFPKLMSLAYRSPLKRQRRCSGFQVTGIFFLQIKYNQTCCAAVLIFTVWVSFFFFLFFFYFWGGGGGG